MFEIIPCEQAGECRNSPVYQPLESAQCSQCRYAEQNGGNLSCWSPRLRGAKHPQQQAEKQAEKREKTTQRMEKRRTKSRQQVGRYRAATLAEAASAETLAAVGFRNTVNSGRKNQDGDHTAPLLRLNLDTKLQQEKIHPVVNLHELAKIRRQAGEVGHLGGLLLRNQNGQGVVVLAEEDFISLAGEFLEAAQEDLDSPLF